MPRSGAAAYLTIYMQYLQTDEDTYDNNSGWRVSALVMVFMGRIVRLRNNE